MRRRDLVAIAGLASGLAAGVRADRALLALLQRRAHARCRRRGLPFEQASSRARPARFGLVQSARGCGAWNTDQRPSLNRYSADERRAPGPRA